MDLLPQFLIDSVLLGGLYPLMAIPPDVTKKIIRLSAKHPKFFTICYF